MEFEDFGHTFTYVSMCHFQFQDADAANVNEGSWHVQRIEGCWDLATAGGVRGGAFSVNQQYLVKIPVSRRVIHKGHKGFSLSINFLSY